MSSFIPSPQQQNVFDWITTGKGSAIVVAVAGAGKTTTLLEAVSRMSGGVFLGAFNKDIADELKQRLESKGIGKKVRAGTMHSAGWGTLRKIAGKAKIDAKKVNNIVDAMIKRQQVHPRYAQFLVEATNFAKQAGLGIPEIGNSYGQWVEMIEHYGLMDNLPLSDFDEATNERIVSEAIGQAQEVLERSIALDYDVVDFNDMIYSPLKHNVAFWQNDWVLIDEAQDTNKVRQLMMRRMLKPGGRLIAVGDPAQAIYGFAGADSNSLENIKTEFNCVELPLTVTYRCPKAVVTEAQIYMPSIQAHESAPEGIVRTVQVTSEEFKPACGDAIICRFNAPIVEMVFTLLRKGIAAKIEGRDIGGGLISLTKRWKVRSLNELRERLDGWKTRETKKLNENSQLDEAKRERRIASLQDRYDVMMILIARCIEQGKHAPFDLIQLIQDMFDNNVKGAVVCSTVHKAKGREWDRVWLLGKERFMPAFFAKQEWELKQENNLIYVALTRAKQELIHVVL